MQNKKGFTLVELIVVITILAILWTIWFISLQWYGSESRDSKRVSDLSQIRTWLQVYQAKEWILPEPDNAITVWSGSVVYTYQWYSGTGTLNTLRISDTAKDPIDNSFYTYTTNTNKTKFQITTMLENGWQTNQTSAIPKTYANYENRDSYSLWYQLWTLLEWTTKTPMQEYGEDIDLSLNTTTEYIPLFSREEKEKTYSWTLLVEELEKVEEWVVVYESCWTTKSWNTKNFYSTEEVPYWESCDTNKLTFTCNDWEWNDEEWNSADTTTYSYDTCSMADDTNSPTWWEVAIDEWDTTNSTTINLTITCPTDAEWSTPIEMYISWDITSTPTWEQCTTSKSLELTSWEWTKTITAKFRDSAGNESNEVSDSINMTNYVLVFEQMHPEFAQVVIVQNSDSLSTSDVYNYKSACEAYGASPIFNGRDWTWTDNGIWNGSWKRHSTHCWNCYSAGSANYVWGFNSFNIYNEADFTSFTWTVQNWSLAAWSEVWGGPVNTSQPNYFNDNNTGWSSNVNLSVGSTFSLGWSVSQGDVQEVSATGSIPNPDYIMCQVYNP